MLRSPNEIVTASKVSSANGSRVPSPAVNGRCGRAFLPTWSIPSEKSHGTTIAPRSANGWLEVPVPAARSSTMLARASGRRPRSPPAPAPVLAEREDVVGDVVALGDGVEHATDVGGLLVELGTDHAAETRESACRATQSGAARRHPRDRRDLPLPRHHPKESSHVVRCAAWRSACSPSLLLVGAAVAAGFAMSTSPTARAAPAPRTAQPRPPSPATDEPVAAARAEPAAAPSPSPGPSRRRAAPLAETPARAAEPGRPLLAPGDKGDEVRDLQARLRQIAWYFGDVDGDYGDVTVEAVRGFQDKRGIPVTGEVDRRTLDRLHAMTTEPSPRPARAAQHPRRPRPRCLTGRVLCVDKTSRTLRWVIDGKVQEDRRRALRLRRLPTREGAFAVVQEPRPRLQPLRHLDAVRDVLLRRPGRALLLRLRRDRLQRRLARLRQRARLRRHRWLFDQVQVGDKVIVYWS